MAKKTTPAPKKTPNPPAAKGTTNGASSPAPAPETDSKNNSESPAETPASSPLKNVGEETTAEKAKAPNPPKERNLWDLVAEAKDNDELKKILCSQLDRILAGSPAASKYHVLMLYSDDFSIGRYTTDRIYSTLRTLAKNKDKPLLLLILSNGGSVESAYLISKACKEYSKDIFAVAIPRHAKSAATLLALGADEIHMGIMSELGPIDPQISIEAQSNRVPALALKHALENVADLCEKYPKATSMFSEYLAKTLKITQLGYYERICKSAAQYAERLLKKHFKGKGEAEKLANKLVYEYKDHGFVIDHEEALHIFNDKFIKYDTDESQLAEKVHELIESFDLALNILKQKKLFWILGRVDMQSTYIKDND